MHTLIFIAISLFLTSDAREQSIAPTKYGVVDESVTLPCSQPGTADFLTWRVIKNGTTSETEAAHIFPGGVPSVFKDFDSPEGRSEIKSTGSFVINTLKLIDEGIYWCEISSVNSQTVFSDKIPLHIYQRPSEPTVVKLDSDILNEYVPQRVARCSSKNGKPGATLRWFNGTKEITAAGVNMISTKSVFEDQLTDTSLDFKLENPTRFDHQRTFDCRIDHPSYSKPKFLNYTVQVRYHPVNIQMWANKTANMVFCSADSFPEPLYSWVLPANIASGGTTADYVYLARLGELPGNSYFICTAYNGLAPNATIRMTVDDLIWPDGRPGWLGLDWWIWAAIFSGIAVLIIIVIVIICCKRRSLKTHGDTLQTKYSKGDKHQQVVVTTRNTDYISRSREDSFDDDISPGPTQPQRRFMAEESYTGDGVTLIPSVDIRKSQENLYNSNPRGSRDNLYNSNTRSSRENLTNSRDNNLHASREQLNDAAEHIATLNKSWDYLSRSREELNHVQSELEHNDMHRSHERLDQRDSIPYMDNSHQDSRYYDDGYNTNTGNYTHNDYPEKVALDDQQYQDDDRYKSYNAPPKYSEGHREQQYSDQYQEDYNNQPYNENRGGQSHDYNQDGDRYYDERNSQQNYDSYDDDRRGSNYNYQPARIV